MTDPDAAVALRVGRRPCITPRGDLFNGGWLNLDSTFAILRVRADMAKVAAGRATGFAPLTKEEAKRCEGHKQVIEVPLGHMLIFFARAGCDTGLTREKNVQSLARRPVDGLFTTRTSPSCVTLQRSVPSRP